MGKYLGGNIIYELPNYKNCTLYFTDDKARYSVGFLVSPSSYSALQSFTRNSTKMLNGWSIHSTGKEPGNLNISGFFLDSYQIQERLNFIIQYRLLMQCEQNDVHEYTNQFEQEIEIEGMIYRGLVSSFSYSKDQSRPYLYNFSLTFVFVEVRESSPSDSRLPEYARDKLNDGRTYVYDDQMSLVPEAPTKVSIDTVTGNNYSRIYTVSSDTKLQEKEEVQKKEQDKEDRQDGKFYVNKSSHKLSIDGGKSFFYGAKITDTDERNLVEYIVDALKGDLIQIYFIETSDTAKYTATNYDKSEDSVKFSKDKVKFKSKSNLICKLESWAGGNAGNPDYGNVKRADLGKAKNWEIDTKYTSLSKKVTTTKSTSSYSSIKTISTLTPTVTITLDSDGNPTKYKTVMTVQATGYTYTGNKCSTGVWPQPGYIAVNPEKIPYGTKMYIKSSDGKYIYGYAEAKDTGGFIKEKPNNVDLFFETTKECKDFGRRNVEIYILE